MAVGDTRGTLFTTLGSMTSPITVGGTSPDQQAPVSVGDLIYVVAAEQGTSTDLSNVADTSTLVGANDIHDNLGNQYKGLTFSSNTLISGRAFYSIATVAGQLNAISVSTGQGNTNDTAIAAVVFQGPFIGHDAWPSNNVDTTSPFTTNVSGTLAQASELVVWWAAVLGNPSNWASLGSPDNLRIKIGIANAGVAIAGRMVSSTTSVAQSFTGTALSDQILGLNSFIKGRKTVGTATASHTVSGVGAATAGAAARAFGTTRTKWDITRAPLYAPPAFELSFHDDDLSVTVGDAVTRSWVAAVLAAGGTVSNARSQLVENMVNTFKLFNLWSRFDRIWLIAAESLIAASIDIVATDTFVLHNEPSPDVGFVFTTDRGIAAQNKSSGNAHIDCPNYIPGGGSSPSVNYQLNSASLFAWARLIATDSGNTGSEATVAGTTKLLLPDATNEPNSNVIWQINDGTQRTTLFSGNKSAGTGIQPGLYAINRSASNARQLYANGALADSSAAASTSLTELPLVILSSRGFTGGTATCDPGNQVSIIAAGASFTADEHVLIDSIFQTYMTAIGA